MTEETKNEIKYQRELFDRLKKSIGLKKEEECIGCIIQPAAWWIVEKPNPKLADLKKLVSCSCPHYKSTSKKNKKIKIEFLKVKCFTKKQALYYPKV